MIKKLLRKYIRRIRCFLKCEEVVYTMDGSVLLKTGLLEFQLKDALVNEIQFYCKNIGFDIDRVIFICFFDTNVREDVEGVKFNSDSKIVVIKKNNEYIAQVFSGSYVEIR
jgi:hypothetical protein